MRRRIRLTGRRQLSRSSVELKIAEVPGKRLLTLGIAEQRSFQGFPPDARVTVRLYENKLVEIADFGNLGSLNAVAEIQNKSFVAPSVQLRVAATSENNRSLLLGSTDSWTLQPEKSNSQNKNTDGILLFLPARTAPRVWSLDIRDDDYPVVYVDERIPDPATWARTDAAFTGCALPAILLQIFEDIFDQSNPHDIEWMQDWIKWAGILMPGKKPPLGESRADRRKWVDDLVDTFAQRHQLADRLLKVLAPENQQ
ncbi:MAG: hypothetical protein EKK33_06850 [Bradyrhizobiaceae bacterium]|nr:MAG: hypothetical protein EKK33_06850 [Bradyrhizobiaceae bacterium]